MAAWSTTSTSRFTRASRQFHPSMSAASAVSCENPSVLDAGAPADARALIPTDARLNGLAKRPRARAQNHLHKLIHGFFVAVGNWAPLCAILIGSMITTPLVAYRPRNSQQVVAIFPPWWSAEQSLAAASELGAVNGFGAFPFIVAVRGFQTALESDLRKAGALIVVDGTGFSLCETIEK